jgi:hypothetical protein
MALNRKCVKRFANGLDSVSLLLLPSLEPSVFQGGFRVKQEKDYDGSFL